MTANMSACTHLCPWCMFVCIYKKVYVRQCVDVWWSRSEGEKCVTICSSHQRSQLNWAKHEESWKYSKTVAYNKLFYKLCIILWSNHQKTSFQASQKMCDVSDLCRHHQSHCVCLQHECTSDCSQLAYSLPFQIVGPHFLGGLV